MIREWIREFPEKKHGRNCRRERRTISETQIDRKNGKKTKLKVRKREKSEIKEEEFKALQVIDKLTSAEENKGKCEILAPSTSM